MHPILPLVIAIAVRLLTGFAVLKYVASKFDPATFGIMTQVMGIAAVFYMFAGGGISNGLIRNLSAATSKEQRQRWISAAVTINVPASLILAAIAFALALFGGALFVGPISTYGYIAIAFVQALVGLGNIPLAYFSGLSKSRTFAASHVAGNILSLLLLIVLVQHTGFIGAVMAVIFAPAIIGVVALIFFFPHMSSASLRIAWDGPLLKDLLRYGVAAACAVTAMPLAQFIVRFDMSQHLGWEIVGYWQAVAKISDAYMLFIGVVFINYLLPELSRRHEVANALGVLFRFGATLLPIFIIVCAVIYLARGYIIPLIYSRQFLPASNFILAQLIGDVLKVMALLLHYYFMSRGRILIVVFSELTQGAAFYVLYRIFAQIAGPLAPVYGYVATYALLLALMLTLLFVTKASARP